MALPIKYNHQVPAGTPTYVDPEELIEALADLAGFTAYKVLDENSNFEGYIIEADDEDLRNFLSAENAAEQHERELVAALGSYMEDE